MTNCFQEIPHGLRNLLEEYAVSRKSTYIIVRKGDKLYYAGNEEAAQQIFEKLPAYGDENLSDDSGYFYNELEKYVKQIDFTFRDGTPGSVFIVTKVNSLISRHLDETQDVPCAGIFVAIGNEPNTALFADSVALDGGYVAADETTRDRKSTRLNSSH